MRVWFLSNFFWWLFLFFYLCHSKGILLETEYVRLGSVLFYLFLFYFIRFLGGWFFFVLGVLFS